MKFKNKQKYYNCKTKSSDGIVFDSHKEASRWEQLRILERAGEITDLQRQVKYEIIPAQYETYERYSKRGERLKDGTRLVERKAEYVADFVYTTKLGELIVEDTKSVATRTKEYILKRKLMRLVHGIRIHEV